MIAPVICLMLFALFCVVGFLYVDGLAYKTVRVEAGVAVTAADFMKKRDADAVFAQDSEPFDIAEPGEYRVKVKSGLFTHTCTLVIEDTIPPRAQPRPVEMRIGEGCGAEAFVSEIQDATRVDVTYETEPDFSQPGSQTVRVVLTDRGGNQAVVETGLYLIQLAEEVTVEAGGQAPDMGSFVIMAQDAVILTKLEDIDYNEVGDYRVLLDVHGKTFSAVLHVVDTVPPQLEVHDVAGYTLTPKTAEEFVTQVQDITRVSFTFRQEPDLSLVGAQEVEIVATDEGGNQVAKKAVLTLQEDREPPVIKGAEDIRFFLGESVSYRKNVTVTDNSGVDVELNIDTSAVDLTAEGIYPVVYTATDPSGNTATVTVNLIAGKRAYTEEEMYAEADAALAQIITPEMSQRDKVWAIYSYVMGHVAYINHSDKGDWIKAAYEGLALGKGDCYVYACTTKALLTRAGITNMDISKIPTRSEHYWNLVDIGEGWRHLDTTPRKDHPVIFLWTDQEMMEYSAQHYNSHNYDPALYPELD